MTVANLGIMPRYEKRSRGWLGVRKGITEATRDRGLRLAFPSQRANTLCFIDMLILRSWALGPPLFFLFSLTFPWMADTGSGSGRGFDAHVGTWELAAVLPVF